LVFVLDHSHRYTCTIVRRLKATHSRKHANFPAQCHKRARLPAWITLQMSFLTPNNTPHNSKTVMPRERLYKGDFASPSKLHITFHNTSYTLSFSSITELSVGVLTCLQAPFVPPQKNHRHHTGIHYRSLEHSLPPLQLNRSHRTYHLALAGGEHSLNRYGPTILHRNRF
jgi:hypothetical protein